MKSSKASSWLQNTWAKLQQPYRLVLINPQTYREERSYTLNRWKFFWFVASFVAFNFLIFLILFRFTPLGTWSGLGSSSSNLASLQANDPKALRGNLEELYLQVDSLALQLAVRDQYIINLQTALLGENIKSVKLDSTLFNDPMEDGSPENTKDQPKPAQDLPGDLVEVSEKTKATQNIEQQARKGLEMQQLVSQTFLDAAFNKNFVLYNPLEGIPTKNDGFAPQLGQYGLILMAPQGSSVRAVRAGTLIWSVWSPETGQVMAVQHQDNLISVYKNLHKPLKKVGDLIRSGEALAQVGAGQPLQQLGPHLLLELWLNGKPINPAPYFSGETTR